jgi:phage repressor protein C with HTH and peptisase S24 domain
MSIEKIKKICGMSEKHFRLKKLRIALGLTQSEFADRIGKKLRTVQEYESGERNFDITTAKLMGYEFSVNGDWLRTGVGGMFLHEKLAVGEVSVPLYDVYASAGYGAWANGEAIIGYYKVPEEMIKHEWKASPNDTVMAHVKGDSMLPLLKDGDMVAVDRSRTEAIKGLYVCRIDNNLYVKNVAFLADSVVLTSENNFYEPLVARYENFELIGRVVWFGRAI